MTESIINFYPNQDPNTIELYEIIGSYFTDIIFNHIYINTKLKLSKGESFTDEYIRRLQLYMIGIKNNSKCFESVIKELNKYYNTINSSLVNVSTFIKKILVTCIPQNFVAQLSDLNEKEIICNIICDLVANLVVYSSSPKNIKNIVDNHALHSKETIKDLQNFAIQVLINKKINILNKFIKQSGQLPESNMENMELMNELKKIINKLNFEKKELEQNVKELEQHIIELNTKNIVLIKREEKLLKLIKLLSINNNLSSTSTQKEEISNQLYIDINENINQNDIDDNIHENIINDIKNNNIQDSIIENNNELIEPSHINNINQDNIIYDNTIIDIKENSDDDTDIENNSDIEENNESYAFSSSTIPKILSLDTI